MTEKVQEDSRIERSSTYGIAWRCTDIKRLSREETGKSHVFFVSAQVDGKEIRDSTVRVQYGWEGMQDKDKTDPVALGAREPNYVEFPAAPGTMCWLTIDDGGQFASDTVHDLHCEAAECGYFVRFQLLRYRDMHNPPAEITHINVAISFPLCRAELNTV